MTGALPTIDVIGDNFILHLPASDRTLTVPRTLIGIDLLAQIIKDSKREWKSHEQPRGYIRNFPTQHVVDAWLREDRAKKLEAAKEKIKEDYGLDVGKLKISL